MNIYSLPALISFTINISIALIIFLDNSKSDLNRWFSAFVAMFALWNFSEILILNSHTYDSALIGAQVLYRIIFLVPAFFVIIAYKFPQSFHSFSGKLTFYFIIFFFPVLFLILSFPDFQLNLVHLAGSKNMFYYHLSYRVDIKFIAQIILSLGYFIWGIVVLILKLRRLKTVSKRNQTLFFLIGFVIIFLTFTIINVYRSSLEKAVSFYFLSTSLTFLISLFFLYVVIHYKVFRVSKLIKTGLVYSTLSGIVFALYVIVIQGLSVSVSEYFNINSYFFTALMIIILVFLMRPVERLVQAKIDVLLGKDMDKYRHNFSKFTHELQEYKPSKEFFEMVKKFIDRNFYTGKTLLFVFDEKNNFFFNEDSPDEVLHIDEYKYFVKKLIKLKRAIEIYELDFNRINSFLKNYFEKHSVQIIVPFIFNDNILAMIFISKKKYAEKFKEEEIERLTIMSDQVSLAFHRNRMFEDLQKRVKEQFRLEMLASIGQMTAGIAHEIRNPLNTISLSAQTLRKEGIADEDKKELLDYISEEVERLERILQDFLKLSKQREIKYSTGDVDEIFDRVILSLEGRNKSGIKVEKEIPDGIQEITTDFDILHQIILNLGINALDAISDRCRADAEFSCGEGRVQLIFRKENSFYEFIVKDNGIGIGEDAEEKILQPFFTTKEEGTGLGLSIVNNLVSLIGGALSYKSKFGETEFIIKLNQNIESEK